MSTTDASRDASDRGAARPGAHRAPEPAPAVDSPATARPLRTARPLGGTPGPLDTAGPLRAVEPLKAVEPSTVVELADNEQSGDKDSGDRTGNFGLALRIPEFRALWFADTVSVLGTQVSRVCLALIVYQETRSATATALIYALTFVPTIVGGALLSGLADRLPRRAVMIATDLARAVLFGVMAIPELSIVVTGTLLVLAVLLDSPFRAAQTATLPDVLPGDSYSAGIALRTISLQAAQLAGYAVGGLLAAAVSPRFGLAVDAVTFLLSALFIARRVKKRPVPVREAEATTATRDYLRGIGSGLRFILGSPRLRILAGLAVLSGFYVVPEGLAPPYAAVIGGGSVAVGLLMAADPAGSALGAWLFVRLLPSETRSRWMAVIAAGPGLVLLLLMLHPGLIASIAIWIAAGMLSVFQIPASVEFVRGLPDQQRGQSLGIVISAMLTAQGLGVLLAGVLASRTTPATAIVVFGCLGALAASYLALRWDRLGSAPASREFWADSVLPSGEDAQ